MKGLKWTIALGMALAVALCSAQTPTTDPTAVTQTYRLRPYDIIRVQVYNEIQINTPITVLPDGRASIPFAGTLELHGKTTAEVEAELVTIYKANLKLKDPRVSVTVEVFRPIRATVLGAFNQPGGSAQAFEFRPGDTILHLVSRAGGASANAADLRRATLIRQSLGGREVIPIDLQAMLVRGDTSQNYLLEDQDVLNLPISMTRFINVQGAVQAPGQYDYREPMYLTDAISVARGPIPIRSKMSEIIVMRRKPGQGQALDFYKVDYVRLIRKRDLTQNMELMPGDTIYVTETKTPDVNQLTNIFNAFFLVDRLLSGGLLGVRLFN